MEKPLLISAGWLIDGTGGPVQENVSLEITEGLIVSIVPGKPDDLKSPDLSDLTSYTLLPGLVDSHAHLFMSGTDDLTIRQHQLKAPFEDMITVMEGHLMDQLLHGVVAVRDGGDYAGHALRYKKEHLPCCGIPVHVRSAGRAWHAPDRYGGLVGRPPLRGHTLAQSLIKEMEGVDHIKIINSGLNSLSVFGRETPPQFELDQLREAVQAGIQLGLKTMVHANGRLPVRLALEAGCHSIEHGFFMGEENLKMMGERKITWVSTVFTMKAYSMAFEKNDREAEIAGKNLDHQLNQIGMAKKYGVPIAVGTDSGSLGVHHGKAISEEIRLLTSAGLSLEEAILCATSNGARLLGLEDELGKLTPHMPATFIAVKGGPDTLLDGLSHPEKIYIRGKEAVSSV